jgi:Uma2 family endonuclease
MERTFATLSKEAMAMTTLTQPPATHPPERCFTVADLAAMPSELPSGPVCYELDNGRLIAMSPPGAIHGKIESNITFHLMAQGEMRGLGKVLCGEAAVILWRNPDRVVGTDVLFVANASLPMNLSSEGYLETIPELVVEVRSKNDTEAAVGRKIEDYLKAGVRVVWDVDQSKFTVTAHRNGQSPHVFTDADTLVVEDVNPGFQLAIRDVFQM